MKQEISMFTRIRQQLDLPSEIQPLQSQIVLAGSGEVTVHSHRGIGTYSPQQIQVRVQRGYATIYGENLEITRMNPFRLVICGQIHNVELEAMP